MIACVPSLLSVLTSGSHKELSDCILIFLPRSADSLVLPSVVPPTVFCNPCSSYCYPDCHRLHRETACRAPGAFNTHALTGTCSSRRSFTFPPVPQPWVQTRAAPLPLQRTSRPTGQGFLGEHGDATVQASLWTQGSSSHVLQRGNTEFQTSLEALVQVMRANKRQSAH